MPPRRRSRRRRLDTSTNRRQFLQALGATTALPFLVALPSWAQPPVSPPATPTAGGTPGATPPAPATTPATAPEPLDAETLANQADARSLFDILQRRYGAKWTPAQADAMRSELESGIANGRALRKLALQNGDEPAVVFRPLALPGGPRS
jgi:hypothetical protein